MRYRSFDKAAWLVISLAVLAASTSAVADEENPTGEQVMERFVEATGGRQAYDGLHNRKVVARLEIPSQGMAFDLTIWTARPHDLYSIIESPVLGRIEKGVSGDVVWEKSIMTGPTIKEGAERDNAVTDATFERFVYWRETYGEAQLVGEGSVGGEQCWKVALTPAGGKPVTLYISKETGLLLKTESTVETEMGSVPVESLLRDFREQDGVMFAYKTVVSVLGQERILTVTSVEHNVDLPDSIFEVPADVRALQE